MKSTDHPGFPPRCVLLCKDSSVRILCPLNGDIITTLLVDSRRGLVDAAYTIESGEKIYNEEQLIFHNK